MRESKIYREIYLKFLPCLETLNEKIFFIGYLRLLNGIVCIVHYNEKYNESTVSMRLFTPDQNNRCTCVCIILNTKCA